MIPRPFDAVKERKDALLWPVYVRRGCLICGTQHRWCPDCHTCTRCGKGCDGCAPYRAAITPDPRISPQNRGGKRGS